MYDLVFILIPFSVHRIHATCDYVIKNITKIHRIPDEAVSFLGQLFCYSYTAEMEMNRRLIGNEKGVIPMVEAIILVFIILLLLAPKKRKPEKKQQRPWYDISYDDIMKYDIFDDD